MSVDRANIRVASLLQGHYNLLSLEKILKSSFDAQKGKINLIIETGNPNSALKLINKDHDSLQINLSHSLANLLGTDTRLGALTYVRKAKDAICLLYSLRSH